MMLIRIIAMMAVSLIAYSVGLTAYCEFHNKEFTPWYFVGGFTFLAMWVMSRGYRRLTAFGTARWADAFDLKKAGVMGADSGLILGRFPRGKGNLFRAAVNIFNWGVKSQEACERFLYGMRVKNPMPDPLVRLPKAVHTAVFAHTGTGKGVSFVIPHLLTCRDSMVVVDFKGELARLTADHRRREFNQKIVILDPFKVVTKRPARFNPVDYIDKESLTAIDDCRDLAEAVVVKTGKESEPHWVDSAEVWIASMIAVTVQYGEPGDRSLQTVRGLLSNPEKMAAVIKLMCESDAWEGMLSRLGHQLTHYKDKELASTLTTTNRFLKFLDTLAVNESTTDSTFNPADLLKGNMTVYLVLPPEHMRAQSALLRMWIGAMLRAVIRGGLQEKHKVHFILDEAASLGHMEALDDAIDKYRGYGVRLLFFYQSLGQLKKCWPDGADQTVLSNTTQVFMAVNDNETAKYVSERLGEETIVVDSGGKSTGGSRSSSGDGKGSNSGENWNRNNNWAQQARKLLKPEEVIGLSDTAITFTPGVPPIFTNVIRYYEEPLLGKRPGLIKRSMSWASLMTSALIWLFVGAVVAWVATQKYQRPWAVFIQERIEHVEEHTRAF